MWLQQQLSQCRSTGCSPTGRQALHRQGLAKAYATAAAPPSSAAATASNPQQHSPDQQQQQQQQQTSPVQQQQQSEVSPGPPRRLPGPPRRSRTPSADKVAVEDALCSSSSSTGSQASAQQQVATSSQGGVQPSDTLVGATAVPKGSHVEPTQAAAAAGAPGAPAAERPVEAPTAAVQAATSAPTGARKPVGPPRKRPLGPPRRPPNRPAAAASCPPIAPAAADNYVGAAHGTLSLAPQQQPAAMPQVPLQLQLQQQQRQQQQTTTHPQQQLAAQQVPLLAAQQQQQAVPQPSRLSPSPAAFKTSLQRYQQWQRQQRALQQEQQQQQQQAQPLPEPVQYPSEAGAGAVVSPAAAETSSVGHSTSAGSQDLVESSAVQAGHIQQEATDHHTAQPVSLRASASSSTAADTVADSKTGGEADTGQICEVPAAAGADGPAAGAGTVTSGDAYAPAADSAVSGAQKGHQTAANPVSSSSSNAPEATTQPGDRNSSNVPPGTTQAGGGDASSSGSGGTAAVLEAPRSHRRSRAVTGTAESSGSSSSSGGGDSVAAATEAQSRRAAREQARSARAAAELAHSDGSSSNTDRVTDDSGPAAAAAVQAGIQQTGIQQPVLTSSAAVRAVTQASTAAVVPWPEAQSHLAPPPPAAAAAAQTPPVSRRVRAASDSSSAGGTGLSASALAQMLRGQSKLGQGASKAVSSKGGQSGSSSSSSRAQRAASSKQEVGEIKQVNGRWVLAGYDADRRALDSLVPALQQRLKAGVQAEQEQEQAAIRKLYAAGTLRTLQKDGVVLLQLQATPSHVLYSSMVWRFSLSARGGQVSGLPYHRFRQGDSLLVSRFSDDKLVEVNERNSRSYGINRASVDGSNDLRPGSNGFRPLDATVVEVRKDHLMLALEKSESDRMEQEVRLAPAAALVSWRLDQSVRDTTARRQLDAIRRLAQPITDSPFEALLRMVLVGTDNGAEGATVPPEWVRDPGWRQEVKQLLAKTEGLNNSQRMAIAKAVLQTLTLWQGPPGTGKTRTLLALVEVVVKTAQQNSRRWSAIGPVLACGDTNAAVDNLVEGLVKKGMRVVRLGQPAKVRSSLQEYTLEAQAERTADGRQAVKLRKDSKDLFEQSKQLAEGKVLSWSNKSRTSSDLARSARVRGSSARPTQAAPASCTSEELEKDAKRKWAQAERLAKQAARLVLQQAEVVCATCSGAGDPLLNDLHFNMVVIDEATQATEPATLVPLTQGARCVVMAGDPAQLPPTVTSREAQQDHQLTLTLFERLQNTLGLETMLLDTQYRMNPAISAFPSRQFYQGRLHDGVTAEQKPAAAGLTWPQPGQPVMFIAVEGQEEKAQRNKGKGRGSDELVSLQDAAAAAAGGLMESSYRNVQEARVVLQAVYALITAGGATAAVTAAILTPYKGQVRTFEHALRVLADWFGPELLSRVTVSSVDGYQGREADVVLFSAVRSNNEGRIGFVSDRRRLNVAITRPRRGLVVVGNPETLRKGSADWKAFLDWCGGEQYISTPRILPAAPWQLDGVDPFMDSGATLSSLSSDSEDAI